MRMTRPLHPSLDSIRAALSGRNEDLPSNVPDTLQPPHEPAGISPDDNAIPPFIAELIARRARAGLQPRGISLHPGRIIAIPPECFGVEEPPEDPVMILLDHEDPRHGLWHGWIVASEADYAGWNDLVIDEEDNLDPAIGLVQAWNEVTLKVPESAISLGALAHDRLAAVRLLAHEAQLGTRTTEPSRPGYIAVRRIGPSLWGTTGSPVGHNDQRQAYRALYRRLAERLSQSFQAANRNSLLENLIGSFLVFAGSAGLLANPTHWIPDAMGEGENATAWQLDDNLEAAFLPATTDAINLRFRLLRPTRAVLTLARHGHLLERETLDHIEAEAAFTITAEEGMTLAIQLDGMPDRIWHLPRKP